MTLNWDIMNLVYLDQRWAYAFSILKSTCYQNDNFVNYNGLFPQADLKEYEKYSLYPEKQGMLLQFYSLERIISCVFLLMNKIRYVVVVSNCTFI